MNFRTEEILEYLYENPELKDINSFYMKSRTIETNEEDRYKK